MRPHPLLAALLLALAGSAQEAGPRPRLVLEGLAGELREIDPTLMEGIEGADPRERDAWLVRPRGFPEAGMSARDGEFARVALVGRGTLRGRIAGGDGEVLFLELIGGVRLPVDVSAMRSIVLPVRLPAGRLVALEAAAEGDRLYRRTGGELDRIDGTLEGFEDAGVRFESVLGSRLFPWDEVAALFVEVLGEPDSNGAGDRVPVVVDLVDGSRLRGALIGMGARVCRLDVAGTELELDWSTVVELAVDDGALVFLSDLPVLREEGRGAAFGDDVGMVWEHRVDKSVLGGPLTTGAQVWRRGIGVHAPSQLAFRLNGPDAGYRSLRGWVGIDDTALRNPEEARGSVVFRLKLDGTVAWESGVVRGGDGAVAIPPLALEEASELVLEADVAGDFRGDRANWLRLVLVR